MFGIVKRPAVAGAADGSRGRSYTRHVDERTGRRLARSTAIFSLATGISRILGLVREIVAKYYFGVGGRVNAFTIAFQVPNLVRALVADAALSSAFVPVFSELLEKGERKRAWRVASSLFWLMLLGLGGLTALFIVLAPWVILPFGNPGGSRSLAVGLSRVLFPIVARRDDRLRLVIDWRDPAVRRVMKLMLPVTLGLGLINFNAVIDSAFASRLINPRLAPAAIDSAFRLYMLPQGMFSVAIATVLFPSLARLAARGDIQGFRNTVSLGLRQIAFLLVPASVVSAVLAEPITRIVYQRGQFHVSQTPVVAAALAAFSAGLMFNGTMLMLNRAFFSPQSNWIPTAVALGNLVLNAGLDAAFYRFGIWGIPLSTSVVNIAGTAVLLYLLRRRLGRIDLRATSDTLARVTTASAVLGGVAFGIWYALDRGLGRSFGGQLVSVGLALTAGTASYLLACRALQVRELDALLALRTRLKRA